MTMERLTCPLCGGNNACALEQKQGSKDSCWCKDMRINADVLARIPPQFQGKVCICAACARAARSSPPFADS